MLYCAYADITCKSEIKDYKYKIIDKNDFELFNKKDKNNINKILEKLNPKTKEILKKYYSITKEDFYFKVATEEKIETLLNDIHLIFAEFEKENAFKYKYDFVDHLLNNLNGKLFNEKKEFLVKLIESEIEPENQIKLLKKMKEISLIYDEEVINKEKENLKNDIFKNKKVLLNNKVVQSI